MTSQECEWSTNFWNFLLVQFISTLCDVDWLRCLCLRPSELSRMKWISLLHEVFFQWCSQYVWNKTGERCNAASIGCSINEKWENGRAGKLLEEKRYEERKEKTIILLFPFITRGEKKSDEQKIGRKKKKETENKYEKELQLKAWLRWTKWILLPLNCKWLTKYFKPFVKNPFLLVSSLYAFLTLLLVPIAAVALFHAVQLIILIQFPWQ